MSTLQTYNDVSYITELPDELLHIILCYIPDDSIDNLVVSCKKFHTILQDDRIWDLRFDKYFPNEFIKEYCANLCWKSIYRLYGFENSQLIPIYVDEVLFTNIRILKSEKMDDVYQQIKDIMNARQVICKFHLANDVLIVGELCGTCIGIYIVKPNIVATTLLGYLWDCIDMIYLRKYQFADIAPVEAIHIE